MGKGPVPSTSRACSSSSEFPRIDSIKGSSFLSPSADEAGCWVPKSSPEKEGDKRDGTGKGISEGMASDLDGSLIHGGSLNLEGDGQHIPQKTGENCSGSSRPPSPKYLPPKPPDSQTVIQGRYHKFQSKRR